MTSTALDIPLKNSKGLVLMVEGAQIDWFGHNNDACHGWCGATTAHTCVSVLVLAMGSNAEYLGATCRNDELGPLLLRLVRTQ